MARQLFSKEDLERIRNAVQDAESKSGGEIVPVFAQQSDYYEVAIWRSGFLFSLIGAGILLGIHYTTDALILVPFYFWLLAMMALGFTGAWLTMTLPGMKRLFTGKELMDKRVEEKADQMFLQHAVFDTQQRVGIMIFISFFEHKVYIKADDGISSVIADEAWQEVMQHLIEKLRKGQKVEALIGAIQECGELVEQSPLEVYPDDDNELDDGLRTVEDE